MARGTKSIPAQFDAEFLDWFREQTEAAWATGAERTPEEVLAQYVEWEVGGCSWQHGTRWLGGLGDEQIMEIERRWNLAFPPDYRLFLQRLHSVDRPMLCARYLAEDESPQAALAGGALATAYVEQADQYMKLVEGPSFYHLLTDMDALEGRYAWLWEGLQFDVEHNDLWRPSWGPKPATLSGQQERVRELVQAAPKLIPIIGHRYLLAEPCTAGNPVFSVWQSDIVVYGADLRDYLVFEFAELLGFSKWTEIERATRARVHERFPGYQAIPFWGELLTH
jgi:hypothetical protein